MSSDQPNSISAENHAHRQHSAHNQLLHGPHFATGKEEPENEMPLRLKQRMERLLQELDSIEHGTVDQYSDDPTIFSDETSSQPTSAESSFQNESLREENRPSEESSEIYSPLPAQAASKTVDVETTSASPKTAQEPSDFGQVLRKVDVDPAAMQPLSQVLETAKFMDPKAWQEISDQYEESEPVPENRNWSSRPDDEFKSESEASTDDLATPKTVHQTESSAIEQSDPEHSCSEDEPRDSLKETTNVRPEESLTETIPTAEPNSSESKEIPMVEQEKSETEQPQSGLVEFQLQASMILQELRTQQEDLTKRRQELDQRQQSIDSQGRLERLRVSEKAREVLQKQHELEKTQKQLIENEFNVRNLESRLEQEAKKLEDAKRELAEPVAIAPAAPDLGKKIPEVTSEEEKELPPEIVPDLKFALAVKRHVQQMEDAPDNPLFQEQSSDSPDDEQPTLRLGNFQEEPKDQQVAKEAVSEKEKQLKKQHSLAIQSMQQQKRRLQLLRSVLVQQQEDWTGKAEQLETERNEWSLHLQAAKENWVSQRQEGERFLAGQQSDIDQHGEMQKQREASLVALEKKLNDAQLQVFRDQTLVKQISRATRKTLSNNDWSELKENIAREAEDFLTGVENQAREIHFQSVQQSQRLEKRQEELETYRQTTQKWVERQNRLLSRRAAHLDGREDEVNSKLEELAEARKELVEKQNQLNDIIGVGLEQIEDEIAGYSKDAA